MSYCKPLQKLIITPELYEEYQEKCRRSDKRITLNCLLLQLGYDPKMCSVWINEEIVYGFEKVFVKQDQQIIVVPVVAGG